MIHIKSPPQSFVQIQPTQDYTCIDELSMCLPVSSLYDLQFQLQIETSLNIELSSIQGYVCTDCNENTATRNPDFIIDIIDVYYDFDNDITINTAIVKGGDDLDYFATLKDDSCFNICIKTSTLHQIVKKCCTWDFGALDNSFNYTVMGLNLNGVEVLFSSYSLPNITLDFLDLNASLINIKQNLVALFIYGAIPNTWTYMSIDNTDTTTTICGAYEHMNNVCFIIDGTWKGTHPMALCPINCTKTIITEPGYKDFYFNILCATIPAIYEADLLALFPFAIIDNIDSYGNLMFHIYADPSQPTPTLTLGGVNYELYYKSCLMQQSSCTSTCFKKIKDTCFTTLLEYGACSDSFGFSYPMGVSFLNSVRLPFTLQKFQVLSEKSLYRKSNSEYVVLGAQLEKEYELVTDYINSDWLEALAVALHHDVVFVTNREAKLRQAGIVTKESMSIDWHEEIPDSIIGKGTAKVYLSEYDYQNSNCEKC